MRLHTQSTRATIRTLTLLFALTSLLLTMISPFVATADAQQSDPGGAGTTCDSLGYEKLNMGSGSETFEWGSIAWGGGTLPDSTATSPNELAWRVESGFTLEFCLKGGNTDPTETGPVEGDGSVTHDNPDISHVGFRIVPTPEAELTLVKRVSNDDGIESSQAEEFTLNAVGPMAHNLTPSIITDGPNFDGSYDSEAEATVTIAGSDLGDYTISETMPADTNYDLVSIDCGTHGTTTGDTLEITLADGDDVVCILVNDDIPEEPTDVELAPSGVLATQCGTWEANFSVAGLNEHEVASNTPFTFEVREGDTVLDSATGLFAGDSGTLSGTFGEDSGTRTITLVAIDADGEGETTDLDTADVDTDCEEPFVIVGEPTISADLLAPTCDNDTPYLEYVVTVTNTDATTATIHWFDADGVEQHTDEVDSLAGRVLWPGAEVDADDEPTDWPGWIQQSDGTWVEGDDGFAWARQDVQVTIEVNPTTSLMSVAYPPPTPNCDASPPEVEVAGEQFERPAPAAKELPRTGLDTGRMALWAALLAGLGALILLATSTPNATVRQRR